MNYNTPSFQQGFNPYQQQMMQNPMMQEYQQRMAQIEQERAGMQAYPCRPVTSVDEVKAVQVDFTGKPLFFYNASAGEVYIKQLMSTGAAAVQTFALQVADTPQEQPTPTEAAPKEELITRSEFNALKAELEEFKNGISTNSTNVQSRNNSKQPADAATVSDDAANDTRKNAATKK